MKILENAFLGVFFRVFPMEILLGPQNWAETRGPRRGPSVSISKVRRIKYISVVLGKVTYLCKFYYNICIYIVL
jgi:hypothetical protein